MAEYHLHARFISRGKGQSAVVGASYIHAEKMLFEREDRTVDLSHFNEEVRVHSDMLIPENTPAWFREMIDGRDHASASAALWNFVENSREHPRAQLCKEIEFAFPLETNIEQNKAMAEEYLSRFTDRGMVVDWAYHHKDGNPHAHAYLTIAPMTEDGFGSTQVPLLDANGEQVRITRRDNGKSQLVQVPWAGEHKKELSLEREAWARVANAHLERAGIDASIDHRSHLARGLEMEPGIHIGPDARAMMERGIITERAEKQAGIEDRNRERIRANPDIILTELTNQQSVFTRSDMAKALHKHFNGDEDHKEFPGLLSAVEASKELVPLRVPGRDETGAKIEATHYTTREMLKIETGMMTRAGLMASSPGFEVKEKHVELAIGRYDFLSDEQKAAVRHVTGEEQLSAIIGYAGAGKSTLLKAAREAWEAQGYNVYGATLAGKAADELQESSGIQSRTLASLELAMQHGRQSFQPGDVYVIDEAGMVGSKQLARFIENAHEGGSKVVLAGDPDQLQPIAAGGAFRAITEKIGYAEVSGIRRQNHDWQRLASLDLANGRMSHAIAAYDAHGHMHEQNFKTQAVLHMAKGIAADVKAGHDVLGLAHTNKDVEKINEAVRGQLKDAGRLKDEAAFPASKGTRNFATGDRVVFLQNDRELGVKNGMLGKVLAADDGKLRVETDNGQTVGFSASRYNSVDHGYAVTIHKSQGATVDRAHVLATRSMSQNLAYVAMTRHREQLDVHYSRKSFEKYAGGMAESMSKTDRKFVSVDFETTSEFGDRRGHDTRKALMNRARDIARGAGDAARSAYDYLKGKIDETSGRASKADKETSDATKPKAKEARTMTQQGAAKPQQQGKAPAPAKQAEPPKQQPPQAKMVAPPKDDAKAKAGTGPVNFKINMPTDMSKVTAPKRQDPKDAKPGDRPSSLLGDALNLGGVTKDVIETARGTNSGGEVPTPKQLHKAAKAEFKEGDDRAKQTKAKMVAPPKSKDRDREP
ncbi:MAG: Ti-type conjugative transfer relaxase TraA [Pseudomonadota bacterium]